MGVAVGADLGARLDQVRARLAEAARRAGRAPGEVTLVAVTKTQPAEVAAAGVRAGLRHLGENRVQEAAAKIPGVADQLAGTGTPPPVWHFIGHLQTNKAAAAVELFQTLESIDGVRLAQVVSRRLAASQPGRSLPALLEVYVGDDPGRPGLRPDELPDAAGQIIDLPGLAVRGLMTVAPLGWDAAATRAAFRQVRRLRDRLAAAYPRVHWGVLSMGMSDDFELAVEEGSTSVRIGRAIFGRREVR